MEKNRSRGDEIVVVGEFPGVLRVCLWHNVIVACWYGDPSAQASNRLTAITQHILESRNAPDKVSYVHLVTGKLKLPDAATRAAFVESTNKYAHRTALSAVVVSGAGFWASAIRGFVTGIGMVAPRSLELRLYGTIEALVPWFPNEHARRTGVALDPELLLQNLARAQRGVSTALSA